MTTVGISEPAQESLPDNKVGGGGLLRATFWSSVSSFANLLSQVIRAKLAALWLGPMGVAVVTQLNSFLIFSQVVGGLGNSSGVVRETSQAHAAGDHDELKAIHQTFLFALTCSSVVALVVAWIAAAAISDFLFATAAYASEVRVTALAVPFAIGARFFQSIIKGYRNVSRLAAINTIGSIISVVCFTLLVLQYHLWGAVVTIVATQFTLFALGGIFLIRDGTQLKLRRPKSLHILKRNITYAVAGLCVGSLGATAGMYFVRSVIAAYGEDPGGIYSATWRLSSVYLGVIFATTTSYYYPTVSRLDDAKEIGKEISNTLRLFQVALTPVIIFMIIFHEPIIRLLLSARFRESGVLLAYQLPGDMFRLAFDIFALALLARGHVKAFVSCYVTWFAAYLGSITAATALSTWLPSCCIAHSMTYTLFGMIAYVVVPASTGWKLDRRAYQTLALSCVHLYAASAVALNAPNLYWAYGLGLSLLTSWVLIHFRDPVAKKILARLKSRLRRE